MTEIPAMILFVRKYAVRFVVGVVLAAILYVSLAVWIPYQREQRIARAIQDCGGKCTFGYAGPDWIPDSARGMPLFDRIFAVRFPPTTVPTDLYRDLASLSSLANLDLACIAHPSEGFDRFIGIGERDRDDSRGCHICAFWRSVLVQI